jgi:hypothetical protein
LTAVCLRKRCAARIWCGAVAQLGERLVRNEEVSGSIPLSSTKTILNNILESSKASETAGLFVVWRPDWASDIH